MPRLRLIPLLGLLLPALLSAQETEKSAPQPLEPDVVLAAVLERVGAQVLTDIDNPSTLILCYGLIDNATGRPVVLSVSPLHGETSALLYLGDKQSLKLKVERLSLTTFRLQLTYAGAAPGGGLIHSLNSRDLMLEALKSATGSAALTIHDQPTTLFFLTRPANVLLDLYSQAGRARIQTPAK